MSIRTRQVQRVPCQVPRMSIRTRQVQRVPCRVPQMPIRTRQVQRVPCRVPQRPIRTRQVQCVPCQVPQMPIRTKAGAECSVPRLTVAYKGRAGLGGSALAPTGVNVALDASWGQVGSKGISQVCTVANESSGQQTSLLDTASLRGRVMHSEAKAQVRCARIRASRAPAARVKYSMKDDQLRSHLNPTPLGFSPEPATSKVSQVVRFSPEIGSQVSPALSLGMVKK